MKKKLEKLLSEFRKEAQKTSTTKEAEKLRIKYLGRKEGLLTKFTSQIKNLPASKRSGVGTKVKQTREEIVKILNKINPEPDRETRESEIDITAPGKKNRSWQSSPNNHRNRRH